MLGSRCRRARLGRAVDTEVRLGRGGWSLEGVHGSRRSGEPPAADGLQVLNGGVGGAHLVYQLRPPSSPKFEQSETGVRASPPGPGGPDSVGARGILVRVAREQLFGTGIHCRMAVSNYTSESRTPPNSLLPFPVPLLPPFFPFQEEMPRRMW
ncbi:hypothetical protein Taro_042874 [Colocasia esculenta]|uniref:Uncharacterized protein n=1 Tax=Colocasia esculenta TaxID=4460 RepID=A0A843WZG2_COLES|nr:hypothetical protein [Colocasia esculenta]